MITKVDNPALNAKKEGAVYNNKGSVRRLVNYEVGNGEKIENGDLYFNDDMDFIDADRVSEIIDNNVKGLSKDDDKFFSLSINPSYDELKWINNDRRKVKAYVKECMSNYAGSFSKKEVSKSDLVWFAIIHDKRIDKKGNVMPGNNMHVHVIVSARDKYQKVNLNVLTRAGKVSRGFELKGFQAKNSNCFQHMFYYEKGRNIYFETQKKLVEKKLDQMQKIGFYNYQLDRIVAVAENLNYNAKFTRNLNALVRECYKTNDVKDYVRFLEVGKKQYLQEVPNGVGVGEFEVKQLQNEITRNEVSKFFEEIERQSEKLENDLQSAHKERMNRRKGLGRKFDQNSNKGL